MSGTGTGTVDTGQLGEAFDSLVSFGGSIPPALIAGGTSIFLVFPLLSRYGSKIASLPAKQAATIWGLMAGVGGIAGQTIAANGVPEGASLNPIEFIPTFITYAVAVAVIGLVVFPPSPAGDFMLDLANNTLGL